MADPSGASIWLRFSGVADMSSVEAAFSFTKDGGPVDGKFSWDESVLHFTPAEAIERNHEYLIELSANAEDDQGVSLDEEFHFVFSTKAEDDRPTLISLAPADGVDLTDRYANVVMAFSEPIDRDSLYAAFSMSPSVKGRFDWSPEDKACAFVPLEPYAWQTEYSLTIQNTLADLSRNTVAKAHKSRFRIGKDRIPPVVLRMANAVDGVEGSAIIMPSLASNASKVFASGWESTWGLVLVFSEPVERESLESLIRIEPAWSYSIDDTSAFGSIFILRPQERLTREKLYSVAVRKGVKDAQGNESTADAVYKFMVDGPATASPIVARLRFRNNPGAVAASALYDDKLCDHSDDYSSVTIASSSFPIGASVGTETYVDIYLSLADGASVDLFSLMNEFSVEGSNSCAAFSMKRMQTRGFAEPQPLALPGLSCVRASLEIKNASDSGIVTFMIGDGFVDSAGNPIAAAWRLPLLK
jgi:hypothetical protein